MGMMYKQKTKNSCSKIYAGIGNIPRMTIFFVVLLFFYPISLVSQHPVENKRAKPVFKIKYAADFGDKFILDGNIKIFEKYKEYQIEPDTADGPEAAHWTRQSTDCYFKAIMVIDDKYLYVAADVTDDDPRGVKDVYEAWQGDALELYIGFYDLRKINDFPSKKYSNDEGDWRIAFMPTGSIALDSWLEKDIPGVESVVFPKFSGDGYIIEARITLDSMAAKGTKFKVSNGLMMPFKIDCIDQDPRKGDEGSRLALGAGGIPASQRLDNSWSFPHTWGMAEIVDAPVSKEENKIRSTEKVKLKDNSHERFHPTTQQSFTSLTEALASAHALMNFSVEGNGEGEYPAGSKETLQKVIDQSSCFLESDTLQSRKDSALSQLYDACSIFESLVKTMPVHIVDKRANKQTRYLYLNLKNLMGKSMLFGMQNATGYGVGWSNDDDRSDIKDVCGDFPAIYGEELRDVTQRIEINRLRYRIISAHERGSLITMCWHQLDPDLRSWMADDLNGENIVAQILPGGARHSEYTGKLKTVAEFFKSLRAKNGEAIPVIFRPYHEHLGTWFWWGDGRCTAEEFNTLWRFTVDYLCDSMNVHNLLWAISPDLKYLDKRDDYFKRFPGNDYVDIYGVDFYYQTPLSKYVVEDFRQRLHFVVQNALENNKIPALTEVGQSGLADKNFYLRIMLNPVKYDSINNFIAYEVTWRNAGKKEFHASYPGNVSVPYFLAFYNDPYTLFESDLPDMYSLPRMDSSAPVFTSYPANQFVSAKTLVEIKVETNKKALVRWSYIDEDYDLMPYRFESGQRTFRHSAVFRAKQNSNNLVYVTAMDVSGIKTVKSICITFTVDTLRAPLLWSDPCYSVKSWGYKKGTLGSRFAAVNSVKKAKTAYYVKDIKLNALPKSVRFIIQYSGGFALHINGSEAFRYNLPGEINLDYYMQPLSADRNIKAVILDSCMIGKLKIGENRIAIEVHEGANGEELFDALFQTDNEMPFYYGSEWSFYDLGRSPLAYTLKQF